MIRRLLANPAFVALLVLAVIGAAVAQWAVGITVVDDGFGWTGEPTAEQLLQLHLLRIAQLVGTPTAFLGVTAVLGMLAIASAAATARARHASAGYSAAASAAADAGASAVVGTDGGEARASDAP